MFCYFLATLSYSEPGNEDYKNLNVCDRLMHLLLPSHFFLPTPLHETPYNEVLKLLSSLIIIESNLLIRKKGTFILNGSLSYTANNLVRLVASRCENSYTLTF
jgi:hypothetical protein